MTRPAHSLPCLFALLVLLSSSLSAYAICFPQLRKVGGDGACTDTDIQSAIDAVVNNALCPAVVAIAGQDLYENQHLGIADKTLRLVGYGSGVTCDQISAVVDCSVFGQCPIGPIVTLDGGDNGRVLSITGTSNVTLRYLWISGGLVSGDGGGIAFSGNGSLILDTSTVSANRANFGGGINMNGTGGEARLTLGSHALVLNNTASVSGGGIRIEGSTRLFALAAPAWVANNHALSGYGGGGEIIGPARADIASAGLPGLAPIVSGNDAVDGGGIAVLDNGAGEGVLRTFAADLAHVVSISGNTASSRGGGVFVDGRADACLYATRIEDNVGEHGAAIYQNSFSDGSFVPDVGVYINGGAPARLGADCGPETIADLGGSATCNPGDADCSTISNNTTLQLDAPFDGEILNVDRLVGERFRMSGNDALTLIWSRGGQLDLRRCLLTDNTMRGPLVTGYGQTKSIHACTIANNAIGDSFVMTFNDGSTSVDLAYDIIAQPGHYTVDWNAFGGGTFDVSYILSNQIAGLPQNNPSVVQGLPTFVDAAAGDYHLEPVAQTALDFGNAGNFDAAVDLDGFSAPLELAAFPNYLPGSADLGAYERQSAFADCGAADSLFCNGFQP